MKIELEPFRKALKQLETSLHFFNSKESKSDLALHMQFRAATIQGFEFSFELAIKMIRRQLSLMITDQQLLAQATFADIIRMAADAGLVTDVKSFLAYRDARNRTSHTYDEMTADQVVEIIPSFFKEATYLLGQLEKRQS